MKLNFKEDPKEWRKSALLAALGLAILSTLLRWRKHLPANAWCALLVLPGLVAICALLQPRWFRGWYRLSLRLGFYSSRFMGWCVLAVLFIFILTPVAFLMRLMGKDPLRLKHPCDATSYWNQARECNPLDRLF
jgi:hypothetical protein